MYTVDKITKTFFKGLRKSLPLKKTICQNANINAQHGEGFFLKTKKHVGAPPNKIVVFRLSIIWDQLSIS